MDGLAHGFCDKRDRFAKSGSMYKVVSSLTWTGFMRPFMASAAASMFPKFATRLFPVSVIQAQMNSSNFWGNTCYEMTSMMDLAADASQAWGCMSTSAMRGSSTSPNRGVLWRVYGGQAICKGYIL